MNLKSRIKQIENRVKTNDSPFCECEKFSGKVYPRYEIVYENDGVRRIENPVADFCEKCLKPIEKQQIILCIVKS